MHPPYRGRQASIGKPAHEARRRLSPRRRSEGFDEKNLQKACEDDIPRRPQLAGFFAHELHEGGQPPLTANVDELRQERNQQGRVRRTKCAVANQQSYVGLPVLNADSELAMGQQCNGYGLEVIRRRRLQARHRETIGRGNQDEVVRLERDRLVSVDRKPAVDISIS